MSADHDRLREAIRVARGECWPSIVTFPNPATVALPRGVIDALADAAESFSSMLVWASGMTTPPAPKTKMVWEVNASGCCSEILPTKEAAMERASTHLDVGRCVGLSRLEIPR